MKKLILTIAAAILCTVSYPQIKELYIVFTSVEGNIIDPPTGIMHNTYKGSDKMYHTFRLSNKDFETTIVTTNSYIFKNSDLSSDREFLDEMKPKSFLDEIEYLDWDVIAPKLTEGEAKELYYKIATTSREGHVYFIDRNDFTQDSIRIVEAIISIPSA
ncbi:MAG: hypothetical protein LIO79_04090 [Rikenellaceae bacterium]|nr:hypothetical protein [Rikenellaceae bacterium]